MKQYKLVNNVLGWIVFAIAAFTYCSTVEPSASFWDCPEFITTAYKMEVGHPPGAPFFMLTGNFFSLFSSDPSEVALMVNIMSALLSALCILFLFWSITHLARKLICTDGIVDATWQIIVIMGSGVAGALAYTWSDTFWFSAVEGEVYAYSSMFTALVFWLILKWEDNADNPGSDKWLVLIFYLTGLSIGVHLLNLLCLPAITLVYYFKKSKNVNAKGSLLAVLVSAVLIGAVLYGVVPGIVKVGGWFELFFVNTIGMGFNSGMIIYMIVLVVIVLAAIWATTQKNRTLINVLFLLTVAMLGIPFYGEGFGSILLGLIVLAVLGWLLFLKRGGGYLVRKRVLNTSLLSMLMLMIGYSTYAVIVIRSAANTPMDQNSPEDVFTLGEYLGREQYGTRPLFFGEAYTSRPEGVNKKDHIQKHEKEDANEPDKYDEVEISGNYRYPSGAKMLFPRMYSSAHAASYNSWLGGDVGMRTANVDYRDDNGNIIGSETIEMPTQWSNLKFFMIYQVNYMYWRYFMWNFAGRQNDIQGFGEKNHGNWITGISFIDNMMYGDQSLLPDDLKNNKGHNVFYCLPLILGLLGLFWQAFNGKRGIQQFWVVFFLFFMTGLAIVLYLNQTPSQPRERDYAYAGSFYAFAIWIGLGVAAIATWADRLIKNKTITACIASVIGLLIPLQMVSQTWDDHDRSGRYACRDFGANYLNTLPDNDCPVIFTNGDNDTFPLWYNQEVEGLRTDARVCNLSYLQTDWYTDQMVRPAYDSKALPITWDRVQYVDNTGYDVFYIQPNKSELDEIKAKDPSVNPYELKYIIDNYARKQKPIPTDSVIVSVNKQNVIKSGMTLPNGPDSIPDYITISWAGKSMITKSEMMIYEMLASSDWKRPLFMSVTLGQENYARLDDYLVLEGLAYRITPFKQKRSVDVEKMYNNMMTRFKYGAVNTPGIYLDETNMRMCRTHRHMFSQLVGNLVALSEQEKANGDEANSKKHLDMARKALEKCKKELPFTTIPVDASDYALAELWVKAGNKKEAEAIFKGVKKQAIDNLKWINSLGEDSYESNADEAERSIQVLYQMMSQMKEYKIPGADSAEKEFEAISSTGIGGFINSQMMMQQQMQMQQQNGGTAGGILGGSGGLQLGL
ncbi:MAG: DUF2723 domain-containing protein [Bacteroidaceae bacterium]|nr:DUF2723 domain-containing protein [Bacteroidaceae bacterium]